MKVGTRRLPLICIEGARNHGLLNISVSDFFETQHKVLYIEEQLKIANFFNAINKKIQLNEDKLLQL